jgi:hypothetical protein
MLPSNELLLIDRLDGALSAEESARADELIRSDKGAAAEWEYLKMVVEAIELNAIREQVVSARRSFKASPASISGSMGEGRVRLMYKTSLRIAAVLILLLGVSIIYRYSTVSNTSLYHQYFTDYRLNTLRGEGNHNAIEEAYRNKNWNEVLAGFNQESAKSNKTYFLAGMAALELQKYAEAASCFESILDANAKSGNSYFEDEGEYYLALACLMNHQTDKGIFLLKKIRGNKNQLYYPLARRIPSTDLKIIELKNEK